MQRADNGSRAFGGSVVDRPRASAVAPTLFLCTFAAQSALFVLAPLLPRLAAEFSVPVAAVGQLRAVSGLAAGAATLGLGLLSSRMRLRRLLVAGLALVAAGSLAAALAPDFATLAVTQVPIGAGLGAVVTAATAAPARWALPQSRTRLLSWALIGPPAAATVGTVVAGLLADVSWRTAWLAVPFAASVIALAVVSTHPRDDPVPRSAARPGGAWRVPGVPGWLAGELLAYSAWSAIPVFSGALLIESYRIAPAAAGLAIGASAAAVVLGNVLARRRVARSPRRLLLGLAPPLACASVAFGAVRPGFAVSVLLLVLLGALAGARALAGSGLGLELAGQEHGVAVMAARTTAQQLGYLFGAGLGGVMIAASGYSGLGILLAALVGLAAVPHVQAHRRRSGTGRAIAPSIEGIARCPAAAGQESIALQAGDGVPDGARRIP